MPFSNRILVYTSRAEIMYCPTMYLNNHDHRREGTKIDKNAHLHIDVYNSKLKEGKFKMMLKKTSCIYR